MRKLETVAPPRRLFQTWAGGAKRGAAALVRLLAFGSGGAESRTSTRVA